MKAAEQRLSLASDAGDAEGVQAALDVRCAMEVVNLLVAQATGRSDPKPIPSSAATPAGHRAYPEIPLVLSGACAFVSRDSRLAQMDQRERQSPVQPYLWRRDRASCASLGPGGYSRAQPLLVAAWHRAVIPRLAVERASGLQRQAIPSDIEQQSAFLARSSGQVRAAMFFSPCELWPYNRDLRFISCLG